MPNLIDDLARIREMQGKEPLPSPHMIQGFEPGSPPVPEYRPQPLNPPMPEGIEDEFLDAGPPAEPAAPPSPLIPRKRTEPQAIVPLPDLPMPSLVVLDRGAAWKGREVLLTDPEERAVRAIVLKAIQRELQADLQAAGVRRVRRAKEAPEAVSAAPRKRGRPRKVQP